jgi:hypothetical protein
MVASMRNIFCPRKKEKFVHYPRHCEEKHDVMERKKELKWMASKELCLDEYLEIPVDR